MTTIIPFAWKRVGPPEASAVFSAFSSPTGEAPAPSCVRGGRPASGARGPHARRGAADGITLAGAPTKARRWRRWLGALLLTVLMGSAAVAQSGKIAGTVTVQGTDQTLPGASVLVVGTSYGAATGFDGEYSIIGVPPGTYSLRVSFVGYSETVVEEVRVQTGLTTRIDVALAEEEAGVGGDVVVTAERPPVQPDETGSVQYLDIGEIEELPVTSTEEAVFVQAGVFFDVQPIVGGLGGSGRGEARYAVRGGDQTEVVWFLDGARTTSLIEGRADQGGSYTSINPLAVQELQILTGGFPAEYGGAQSGVVNVVTKEGGDRLEASAEYLYGPSGQRHFGNYLYDPATQKEFLDHTLPDGTLDPEWWTEERRSQVYDYRDLTDHIARASVGGPLPFWDGGVFLAGQFNRTAYTYPHPIDHRQLDDVMGNVVLRPGRRCGSASVASMAAPSTRRSRRTVTSRVRPNTTGAGAPYSIPATPSRRWTSPTCSRASCSTTSR